MRAAPQLQRRIYGFVAAGVLTPLAIWGTCSIAAFRSIPWTLSYLVVAFVSEVGGGGATALSMAIATAGIYGLVLSPTPLHLFDRTAWIQTATFLVTALFISYLVRQRKLAVESMRAGEQHYRSVAETASDVIVTIDEESQILSINPAVKVTFGYEPEELIGGKIGQLMPERFRGPHSAGIARFRATGNRNIPWTGVQLPGLRKDGEEIPLEISFAAHTAEGKTRFTGFIRDVSERQRTQAALLQSEKLAAVGRLASSIAHEINNPLESVTNLLYLSRGSEDVETVRGYLALAEQELRRVSVIANQTLQFHKLSNSPRGTDSRELMSGSVALYQGKLANTEIVVEQRYRASKEVYCIPGEMRQVLNNLIGNSIDAMPRGGRILTRSRDATDGAGRKGVVLTVADTGTGLGPEVRARMFEPFFSTKGAGGTGLGLWVCSQLIARNGGTLHLRSSQKNGASGTVFVLFLPDPE